jgi:hypothetical protein
MVREDRGNDLPVFSQNDLYGISDSQESWYFMKPLGSKLLLCSLLWSVLSVFPLKAQEFSNPPVLEIPLDISTEDPLLPLTEKDKFTVYMKKTYGPGAFLKSGAIARINQAENQPVEWGRGWDGYGDRFGSSMGQRAVANTISFGVGALRGEDPRFFPSEQERTADRIKNALAQTFVVHTDQGGRTVAVGRIAGALGGGLVARTWQPDRRGIVWLGVQNGAISLAFDAASNVFREFWPDIKRHLHYHSFHQKTSGAGSAPTVKTTTY